MDQPAPSVVGVRKDSVIGQIAVAVVGKGSTGPAQVLVHEQIAAGPAEYAVC